MRLRRYRDPSAGWRFNMTPLIDVTFLLLTYFMLASHFASAEKPDAVKVPHPEPSQALDRKFEDKIIINLIYHEGQSQPELTFGPLTVASLTELDQRLGELAERNPQVEVVLRADRRLQYGAVRRVMELIASHHLARLQVVAELEEVP